MGELANDVINGKACQLCTSFFIEEKQRNNYYIELYEHGYPVVCWDCWKELSDKEKKRYQKAKVGTL